MPQSPHVPRGPSANRVVFRDIPIEELLSIYTRSLGTYAWKNRLVGLTRSGFLYVDQRRPKHGAYEFEPKVLAWSDVRQVSIFKFLHIVGALFGVLLLVPGVCIFAAAWIYNLIHGLGTITLPLLFAAAGATFIFGSLRNCIEVVTPTTTYRWVSPPLAYRPTLSLCREAAAESRARGLLLLTHVD